MSGSSEQISFSKRIILLNFILSVLVIYIHGNNLYNVGLDQATESLDWRVTQLIGTGIGRVAVPFFFMISGYLFFRFDFKTNNVFYIIKGKIQRRVKTLVVPYLLWNTIGFLFYAIITRIPVILAMMNLGKPVPVTIQSIFNGVFLHGLYHPFWYLHDLIILVFLSPLIFLLVRYCKVCVCVIAILTVINCLNVQYLWCLQTQTLLFFWKEHTL